MVKKLSYLQLEDFIKNLKVADSLFLMDRIDKLNKKVGLRQVLTLRALSAVVIY